MKRTDSAPLRLYILKGVGGGVAATAVKSFTNLIIYAVYATQDIQNYQINIICFIASIIVYNSIFGILLMFDKTSCDIYLKQKTQKPDISFIKETFGNVYFVAEFLSTVSVMSLAAALGTAKEIAGMFYMQDGVSPYSIGIIPFSATLLISSSLLIYERYEAVRYWKALNKRGELDELTSKPKIIIRILTVAVGYPLILPYLPLIAAVFLSFIRVIALVITLPALIAIFVAVILLIFAIKILKVVHERRSFFKKLTILARQRELTVKDIKNPYISLLKRSRHCSFLLENKKSTYACTVLGHVRRAVICFTSSTEGYYRHRIGTKRHNITLQQHFKLTQEGAYTKIIIINPTPKNAYICESGSSKEKRLLNADRLWDSTVYEADAFLRATDNEVLGKYASSSHSADRNG